MNSDLAFWVNIAAAGNYNGFRLLDISKPEDPVVLTTVTCRGAQGDVSFYKAKNRLLLFVSVDTPQTVPGPPPGGKDCVSADSTEALGFEGIRIWDVTDPVAPKFVKFVRTDCGSHTHTTIPDYDNQRALIYVSSYPLAATGIGPNCGQPNPEVLGRPHGKISIVEVPDTAPEAAEVLKEVSLHADTIPSVGEDGSLVGSVGCHDITAFFDANQASEGGNTKPKPQLAAAACLSEGQIWDIRDPANPRTQDPLGHSHVQNESVEIWHSAAWTWDGQVVLFGDEHGGGSAPGCGGPQDTTGNIWFYRQVPPPGPLPLLGRYALERNQLVDQPAPQECTLHNFNVIPINDNKAYIGVSSAYKGGTTVFDFSQAKTQAPFTCPLVPPADPCEFAAPIIGKEIGFYDSHSGDGQGHDDAWSTYWYNDYIYANSGLGRNTVGQNRGFDVYKLLLDANMKPCKPEQKGCTPFNARDFHHLNAQTQEGFQTLDGGGTKTGG
ncbi:MAG TPA: hypothetical protein VHH54_05100 [Actinomycetota bacterium]|nr:hypothetical protein [Actinomycetota bacterium]